jgi:hypothetical protein
MDIICEPCPQLSLGLESSVKLVGDHFDILGVVLQDANSGFRLIENRKRIWGPL